MINFKKIKNKYPLAFKALKEYYSDGIGSWDVKKLDGYGYIFYYFGDTNDLDHVLEERKLYDFFDEYNVFVTIQLNLKHILLRNQSLSKNKVGFMYSIIDYDTLNTNHINMSFRKKIYSRHIVETKAFKKAFEILNNKLKNNE